MILQLKNINLAEHGDVLYFFSSPVVPFLMNELVNKILKKEKKTRHVKCRHGEKDLG
jgi:hypothetical protein